MKSESRPLVQAVIAVMSDQNDTIASNTFFGPKRSASQPPGICPTAYAQANAENTRPMSILLNPNSLAMAVAVTEMLARSM